MKNPFRSATSPPTPAQDYLLSCASMAETRALALKDEANVLFKSGSYTEAIDKYSAAIDLHPANHTFFSNRAACHLELGKKEWAEKRTTHLKAGLADARKCVELDPTFQRGLLRLASLAWMCAKDARDDHKFKTAEDTPKDSAFGEGAMTELCAECERTCRMGLTHDASNEALREVLQELRDCREYEMDPAADETARAGASEASAVLIRTIALKHKEKGNKLFAAKNYEDAAAAFTSAMAFDPTDQVFYSNRSACRSSTGKHEEALYDADRCIALKADWSKGFNRRAVALYHLGRYPEAEQACIAGLALEEGSAALKDMLVTCQKETCETPEVQAQMARLREEARSQEQLEALMSKLNTGGQGGPNVFNMSNLNMSGGGLQDLFSGMGGGGGNKKPKMSEEQMRQMARAMASAGPVGSKSPPTGDSSKPSVVIEDADGEDSDAELVAD